LQAPCSAIRFYAIQQVQQTAKYQPIHYKAPYSSVTKLLVIKTVNSITECVVIDKPKSYKLKIWIIQVSSSKYTCNRIRFINSDKILQHLVCITFSLEY